MTIHQRRRTTISDVARAAHVSKSTVSRALHDSSQVSEAVKQQVVAIAENMGFTPSRDAFALVTGKTMRCAIIFPDRLDTWFNSHAIEGAYEILSKASYDLIPMSITKKSGMEQLFAQMPENRNFDGIILASVGLDQDKAERVSRLSIPCVGLDSANTNGYTATVQFDNTDALQQSFGLLRSLGHKRIGFVETPATGDFAMYASKTRAHLFPQIGENYGYNPSNLITYQSGILWQRNALHDIVSSCAARIISSNPRPTALCVETDDFAIELITQLKAAGIRIPEDISVIGFDDTPPAHIVGLTTIHHTPADMARQAASKLLTLMDGGQPSELNTVIRGTLLPRETTARADTTE